MSITSNSSHSKKAGIFYGWWIVVAGFFCNLIIIGHTIAAFSLFVKPLEDTFPWSRDEIMTAFTIFFLSMGISQLVVGRLVDRFGARKVIFTGGLVTGLGFILMSRMTGIWEFYLGYVMVGAGAAASSTVPISIVISQWFKKRRGVALGIASVGIGAGGIATGPFVGNYLLPVYQWSNSYLAIAVVIWIIVSALSTSGYQD